MTTDDEAELKALREEVLALRTAVAVMAVSHTPPPAPDPPPAPPTPTGSQVVRVYEHSIVVSRTPSRQDIEIARKRLFSKLGEMDDMPVDVTTTAEGGNSRVVLKVGILEIPTAQRNPRGDPGSGTSGTSPLNDFMAKMLRERMMQEREMTEMLMGRPGPQPALPQTTELRLQAGKRYRARNGTVCTIKSNPGNSTYPFADTDNLCTWRENGQCHALHPRHDYDLVAEVTAAPEVPATRLKLQAGKRYKDREGRVYVVQAGHNQAYPFEDGDCRTWMADGTFRANQRDRRDLVAEVTEP